MIIDESDLIKWADGIFTGHMPPDRDIIKELASELLIRKNIIDSALDELDDFENLDAKEADRAVRVVCCLLEKAL